MGRIGHEGEGQLRLGGHGCGGGEEPYGEQCGEHLLHLTPSRFALRPTSKSASRCRRFSRNADELSMLRGLVSAMATMSRIRVGFAENRMMRSASSSASSRSCVTKTI